MKILIIFNHEPYDSTDVTWNGLRLADKLVDTGSEVRIFLMSDAVDMARDVCRPPEGYDQDLSQICLLYTSPSPRDGLLSRMPSSA